VLILPARPQPHRQGVNRTGGSPRRPTAALPLTRARPATHPTRSSKTFHSPARTPPGARTLAISGPTTTMSNRCIALPVSTAWTDSSGSGIPSALPAPHGPPARPDATRTASPDPVRPRRPQHPARRAWQSACRSRHRGRAPAARAPAPAPNATRPRIVRPMLRVRGRRVTERRTGRGRLLHAATLPTPQPTLLTNPIRGRVTRSRPQSFGGAPAADPSRTGRITRS